MYRCFRYCLLFIFSYCGGFAYEGMWLPWQLDSSVYSQMKEIGLQLTEEDLYADAPSMKDAIVIFNYRCSGAFLSDSGLIITNHHCADDLLATIPDSAEQILKNGFWANSRDEEIPCEEANIELYSSVTNVSDIILKGLSDTCTAMGREQLVQTNIKLFLAEQTAKPQEQFRIVDFYDGREYYLIKTIMYTDVRLVGSPPFDVARFGEKDDNWKWPRHCADAIFFRVYADSLNNPAEYSENNIPYHSQQYFRIKEKPIDSKEFCFVYSTPHHTDCALPSGALKTLLEYTNPKFEKLHASRISMFDSAIAQNSNYKMEVYDQNYSISVNVDTQKKGESQGLLRYDAVGKMQDYEKSIVQDPELTEAQRDLYVSLLKAYNEAYQEYSYCYINFQYFYENFFSTPYFKYIAKHLRIPLRYCDGTINEVTKRYAYHCNNYFDNFDYEVEKFFVENNLTLFTQEVSEEYWPDCLRELIVKYGGPKKVSEKLMQRSLFSEEQKVRNLINGLSEETDNCKNSKVLKPLKQDIAFRLCQSFYSKLSQEIFPAQVNAETKLDSIKRLYYSFLENNDRELIGYPNANRTPRLSFGVSKSYSSTDGVEYEYMTTMRGYLEKVKKDTLVYKNHPFMAKILEKQKNDSLSICFINTCHTSAGSSGSPVLNAKGEFIGLDFDRNIEGTMSDIMYDPDVCRNIAVTSEYLLFLIENLSHNNYILDELNIVK